MGFDLVSFGETLLRLSPPGPQTIEQTSALNLYLAGSELNVAVGASRMGLDVAYVSRVANNPLGQFVINKCREQGVDTRWILKSEDDRQGLYFFENGSPPRPGVAYYDRAYSAFSKLIPNEFNWREILADSKLFLTSGINFPLSEQAHDACFAALKTAKDIGVKTVFDINYRSKLWDIETASNTVKEILPYVDILFTSGGDARDILNYDQIDDKLPERIAQDFGIETVCLIYNAKQPSSLWRIVCYSNGQTFSLDQSGPLHTVDRLGAGDSLAAGFLTGILESGPERALKMGNAMMSLKNTYLGDFTYTTREQIEAFIAGDDDMVKR